MFRPLAVFALPVLMTAQVDVLQQRGRPGSGPVRSPTAAQSVQVVGSVAVQHGGALDQPVRVLMTCMGRMSQTAVTDPRGRFRFFLDGATTRSAPCTVQAVAPGLESTRVMVPAPHPMQESINVGVIKLSDGGPDVISITSANAPKTARKRLERGRRLASKRKPELAKARVELRAAVDEYDDYAEAWLELAGVLEKLEKPVEALNAYGEAIPG